MKSEVRPANAGQRSVNKKSTYIALAITLGTVGFALLVFYLVSNYPKVAAVLGVLLFITGVVGFFFALRSGLKIHFKSKSDEQN